MSTTHTATENPVRTAAFEAACRRIRATTTGMLTSDQLDACERHANRAVANFRQQEADRAALDAEIEESSAAPASA